MKKRTIILFFAICTSCNAQNSNQNFLKSSNAINSVFNKKEISDLHKIVTFFDIKIRSTFKSESLIKSYKMFNEKDLELKKEGLIFGNISAIEQNRLNSSIKRETFNEVWKLGKSIKENGEKLDILFINPNGKYAKFLQKLGTTNNLVKNYIKIIKETEDLPPTLFYFITDNYKNIDITNENIRLIIAIHYLTLNDNQRNTKKI